MKTVRELSGAGPCFTLGVVLRETAWCISYRDRHGTSKFISKRWAVHTEPCPAVYPFRYFVLAGGADRHQIFRLEESRDVALGRTRSRSALE